MDMLQLHVVPLDGDARMVVIDGEIDMYSAPAVKELIGELIDGGEKKLAVNLERVKYIDSIGLLVFASAQKRLHEIDGKLVLITSATRIQRLLALTGLTESLHVFTDASQASSALCPG